MTLSRRRFLIKGTAATAGLMLWRLGGHEGASAADETGAALPTAFNPLPKTIQSPLGPGGAQAALQRLSAGSDGKTPTVKNFTVGWLKSLTERGTPKVYTAENSTNFAYIGMPVGGIGTGQVYLGGDGKLWWWDIFNTRASVWPNDQFNAFVMPYHENDPTDAHQYAIQQGFALRVGTGGEAQTRTLDKAGFSDIRFTGQYPIGTVTYYAMPPCRSRSHWKLSRRLSR